jgi:hypothetical protein
MTVSTKQAVATIPESEYKSKLEARFAGLLGEWKLGGGILEWRYEPVSMKIGKDCRYTPDFLVLGTDLTITFYETKGTWLGKGQAAARVRLRAAANTYPFWRFIVAYWSKSEGWRYDQIPPLP